MNEQLVVRNIANAFKYSYHTEGKTGDNFVGDLLEQQLGKDVDNKSLPDLSEIDTELKTHWKASLTTMFTKEPKSGKSKYIYENYSYMSEDGKRKLNMSVTVNKNGQGFYLTADEDKIKIKNDGKVLCSLVTEEIVEIANEKMPNLFFVKYDIQNQWLTYRDLISYKKINKKSVVRLINAGVLSIDFRLSQYKNGKMRNRGTAFRLKTSTSSNVYDKLYSEIKTIIKDGVLVRD